MAQFVALWAFIYLTGKFSSYLEVYKVKYTLSSGRKKLLASLFVGHYVLLILGGIYFFSAAQLVDNPMLLFLILGFTSIISRFIETLRLYNEKLSPKELFIEWLNEVIRVTSCSLAVFTFSSHTFWGYLAFASMILLVLKIYVWVVLLKGAYPKYQWFSKGCVLTCMFAVAALLVLETSSLAFASVFCILILIFCFNITSRLEMYY